MIQETGDSTQEKGKGEPQKYGEKKKSRLTDVQQI